MTELVAADQAQSEALYVENLHDADGEFDPVIELADQSHFAESAGAYLITGNRGTGKT